MRKFYYKTFALMILIAALTGCKLDAPVYPAGSVATTGTGTDPNDGSGLPIDAASNIEVQIGGIVYKYKQVASFGVFPPNSIEAHNAGTPFGYTGLQAYGTSIADPAGITFNNSTTGTFDIASIQVSSFTENSDGTGKIKVTKLTSNNIQGTFTVDLVDANDDTKVYKNCPGSFNINN